MSTETVLLSRKLERLRKQYKNNSDNMDVIRKNYERTVSRELEELRNDIQEKVTSHNEMLSAQYHKEFETYRERMDKQLKLEVEKINDEYAKLKNENDDMRIEMNRIEKELSEELHDMSRRITEKENLKEEEARRRMEKVYDVFGDFSRKYPHEFFEPNSADALLMQMEQSKVDFRLGFYEACMANSSSMEFQIAAAEDRIKKSFDQWKRYFYQLEAYTIHVKEFIESEQFRIVQNDFFEKELFCKVTDGRESDTFDFWCNEEYSWIILEIEKYQQVTQRICQCKGESKEEKIVDFLKNQRKYENAMTFEELADMVHNVTDIHRKTCDLAHHIHTNFTSSFMRGAVISLKLIKYLSDTRGCEILKKGFKDGDIRNEYFIFAKEAGKNINISIFPICTDNVVVINYIGIFIEHTGNGTAENLKATQDSLVNQIKEISGDVQIILQSNKSFDDMQKAFDSMKDTAAQKRRKEISAMRRTR